MKHLPPKPRIKRQADYQPRVMQMSELNVINWAIALVRAKTPKSRKHAAKMLVSSVEWLGAV